MKNILYILAVILLAVSCMGLNETGPDEMTVPEVKSFTVDDNGGSLVFTLTSSVDKKVLGRINECGFYYGKDRDMSDAERVVCKVADTEFSADIALHEYGETFYAVSFVTSGAGTHEMTSEAKEMTLGELKDYVELETPDLLSYDRNSARVEVSYEAAEGVVVTEYGICYADFADPKLSDNSSEAVEGVVSVDGLEPGKAYHMCPYLKDGEHVVYGKSVPLAVYGLPVVVTAENPEKDTDSAVLCGEVQDDCGKKVTERGFLWRADAVQSLDPESDNKVKAGSGLGPFSATIEELEPNRNYSFCAYAVNEEGMAFGEVVRFTTGVAMPVHGLPEVVDITPFKAVFHGNVLSDGGETPSEFGFFWGSDKNVDKKIVCTGEDFMYEVEGLQRNTVYYVKSYSINSKGTAYSDLLEFRTLPELPEVSTGQVSGIFEYGAVCGGTIIDDGGAEILDKGICYSAGTEFSSATKISSGRGLAAFTCTVDGLDPNKTYYVCAYAENSAGISYGEQMSFTTETALAELSVTVVTDVTSSTAALRSSVLDEGGENPYEVGFYYSESENVEAVLHWWNWLSKDQETKNIAWGGLEYFEVIDGKYYEKKAADRPEGYVAQAYGMHNYCPALLPGERAATDNSKPPTSVRMEFIEENKHLTNQEGFPIAFGDAAAAEERAFMETELFAYIQTFTANAIANGVTDASWDQHLKDLKTVQYYDWLQWYQDFVDEVNSR